MPNALSQPADTSTSAHLRGPLAWLRSQALAKEYWIFFCVALFFDAGFAIYFFLFNLFLLDAHTTERAIGLINGAFTLGSTLATLPAGALGRRIGVKPLLLVCILTASLLGAARIVFLGTTPQIVLGFLAGASMSLWGIAYLPAVARLTNDQNRASAYSLIFCASIVTSAIGGAVTGYLPRWLTHFAILRSELVMHRWILLASCLIGVLAIIPAARLRLQPGKTTDEEQAGILTGFRLTPFLLRFLPCMALWTACMGAFLPFANIYLVRQNFVPMQKIGLVFSPGQCLQLFLGLMTPAVIRALGLLRGILAMQLVAVSCLCGLALSHSGPVAILLYLLFSTAHWMCSPALYNLLMSEVNDAQRSHAAAMVMFLNALLSSLTVTLAGASFSRFGYAIPLGVIACAGVIVAVSLFRLVSPYMRQEYP
ncbi:MFS transporter [Granulicella sibirica]|uniref:Putative permease (Major facilitator superfamily) n=1 Tax=Granulicella sibirica TaxID=2479048 RepID=A0A4V1L517_9BACT|nr:MFS transporter [Granulicella sibirica]RXH54204.1 putative permease (major facilitator superfamily) [Granulicella sibirica]